MTQRKCLYRLIIVLAICSLLAITGCSNQNAENNIPIFPDSGDSMILQTSPVADSSALQSPNADSQIGLDHSAMLVEKPGATLTVAQNSSEKVQDILISTPGRIELTKDTGIEPGEEPGLTVTATGLVFIDSPDIRQFTFTNLPDGIIAAAERISDTAVLIQLSGTPTMEAVETTIGLSISKEQFENPPIDDVVVVSSAVIVVNKAQSAKLTGERIDLTEGTEIKPGGEPTLIVTVTGLTFSASLDREKFAFTNLPRGVSADVERISDTMVTVKLFGTPSVETPEAIIGLSIGMNQFETPPLNDISADSAVAVVVNALPSATLSEARVELKKNTEIAVGEEPVLTLTVAGLTFVDSPDVNHFTFANLPDGIIGDVERTSNTTVSIKLSGTPADESPEAVIGLSINRDQFTIPPADDVVVDSSATIVVNASQNKVWIAVFVVAVTAALIAFVVICCLKRKRTTSITSPVLEDDTPTEQVSQLTDCGEAKATANAGSQAQNAYWVQVVKIHNIGRRESQQDSLGFVDLNDGVLAVVADGMGGLAGGDQISQNVVMSILRQADSLRPGQMDGALNTMVQCANEEINQQLGPDGIGRCGSTVIAVLVRGGFFHWISVGDSRIYLYRGGSIIQLNQEHTYEVELMQKVMNGEITQKEVFSNPQKRGLTSFIGMGRLKYVDVSMRSIKLQSGDRLLLMTDGVFNNLSEAVISDIIRRNQNIQQAAKVLEGQVLALQDPTQDNFTAILLGF